ncbi:MAG: hypothetical protein V3571_11430 [Pseudodesulfovibrio sp.]
MKKFLWGTLLALTLLSFSAISSQAATVRVTGSVVWVAMVDGQFALCVKTSSGTRYTRYINDADGTTAGNRLISIALTALSTGKDIEGLIDTTVGTSSWGAGSWTQIYLYQ